MNEKKLFVAFLGFLFKTSSSTRGDRGRYSNELDLCVC